MSSSKSKKQKSRRSKRVTSTISPDVGQLFTDSDMPEPVSFQPTSGLEPSVGGRHRQKAVINEPLVDFTFANDSFSEVPSPRNEPTRNTEVTPIQLEPEADSRNTRVALLTDFWKDEEVVEDEKEGERFNEFFTDSVHNSKSRSRAADESLSKRIQVGLYPADADLLEELFLQSKAAGLKNVSRARILRVALRHFHTCWLNADSN